MRRSSWVLLIVAALLLAACGGQGGASSGTSSGTTGATSATSAVAPTSGVSSSSTVTATGAMSGAGNLAAATSAVTSTGAVTGTGAVTSTGATTGTASSATTPESKEKGEVGSSDTITHTGGTAAGTENLPDTVGDATRGQALFNSATLGKSNSLPGCKTCHSVEEGKTIVGPSLEGIGTDAQTAFTETDYKGQAKDAVQFLHEVIMYPNADIAGGFAPNVMPQNYKDELTPQQLDDLVAYLQTLK